MGIELALQGYPPLGCPAVNVSSELPDRDEAAMSQRRRWEHGQLGTLVKYGPRLIGLGLLCGKTDLLGLGLDIIVPPLALLVMLTGATTAIAALAALFGVCSTIPMVLGIAGLGAVVLSIAAAWLKFGRATLALRYLPVVPLYRRTLTYAMKRKVQLVQWPSDAPELRWLRSQ